MSENTGIIRGWSYVSEDQRSADLIGIESYLKKIDKVVSKSSSISLIGIIGNYGSGKSVMLENYRKSLKVKHKWIHFDAWKYPDRLNLWDGFVLDFVSEVSPKNFKNVLDRLNGETGKGPATLISTFGEFSNLIIPGSKGAIDKLTYFTASSPATRLFQVQDIFRAILKENYNEEIYIVVEDADRSGPAGLYFLETLQHFLKNLDTENSVKVLIPIARKSFTENQDTYIKVLDHAVSYNLAIKDFRQLAANMLKDEICQNHIMFDHIVQWLFTLSNYYGLSVREIKFIIRCSEINFQALQQAGYSPDQRVVIILESSKFIHQEVEGIKSTAYEHIIRRSSTFGGPIDTILYAISSGLAQEDMIRVLNAPSRPKRFSNKIKFIDVDENEESLPFEVNERLQLPDYYLFKGV